MTGRALYNEIEPYAADWLVNLERAGHIAPGVVERRSVADLVGADVRDATQFHAFAGIGVWARALRLAGWPDDAPVWTGSCPCQPFSAAGRRGGFDDARHLWPAWFRLIHECRPAMVFGEQVASADGLAWLDAVFADLERDGYTCAAADIPACGVGAPHKRNRLYFVAHTEEVRRGPWRAGLARVGQELSGRALESRGPRAPRELADANGVVRGQGSAQPRGSDHRSDADAWPGPCGGGARLVADTDEQRREGERLPVRERRPLAPDAEARRCGETRDVGDSSGARSGRDPAAAAAAQEAGQGVGEIDRRSGDELGATGATRGFWRGAEWVYCLDDKWRAVEPGAQQMADGFAERMGRVRPRTVKAITEAIRRGGVDDDSAREALRTMWCNLAEEAIQEGHGGAKRALDAPVLLAFMRELSREGWQLVDHFPSACAEDVQAGLREMRSEASTDACASCRREPGEQRTGELGDALSVVSQAIASAVSAEWPLPHPLAVGATARSGRIRAFGNSIIAPLAAEFIAAAVEAIRDGQGL